ncbi:MAG: SPOR domain-containing protein [Bacteroidia bacterium]
MWKKQIIFLFSFLVLICHFAEAQNAKTDSLQSRTTVKDSSRSTIVKDTRIDNLIQKQIALNEKLKGRIAGYRIQIHFGIDKAKALDVKSKFMSKFGNYPSYEIYEQPYFKIRVGDFRTRLEAFNFLQQISDAFPVAFLVRDQIELPKIGN